MAVIMIKSVLLFVFIAASLVTGKRVYNMKMGKDPDKFYWENCNKTVTPLAFRVLSLSPNPIKYGQDLLITAELDVTKIIGTTHSLKAEVTANLVVGDQKYSMCDYKPEYCHIQDVCKAITDLKLPCPAIVKKKGSNCECPLKPNTYSVKQIKIPVPNPGVQLEGHYQVQVNLSEKNEQVGCFFVNFCLGSCSSD
ncbi:ganglioside GM2 activator-like [Ruditapes philippinarum]|uniref:ganglioside GM2 activator-like n=1 Tax=Ruditapes philippinarum TaxID=129788 RepID=UPI00295BA0BD|nr:ganglioside GM2 activator-like [Ruditapes philippinarum]